jgi:hypothetical protein
MFAYGIVNAFCKVFVGPLTASKAHEGKSWWKEPAIGEIVNSWHHLFARKITGDAKKHHGARTRNPG